MKLIQLSRCGGRRYLPPPTTDLHAGDFLCLFDSRHRHSGDPETHGAKEVPVGEIECLPIRTTEGEVGCLRLARDGAPELLALRIEYPYAPRATTIDVAGSVNLHAVRHAGLGTAEVRKHAVGLACQRPAGRQAARA